MRPVTFVLLGVRSAAVANPISLWVAGVFMLPHTDSYPFEIYIRCIFARFSFNFRPRVLRFNPQECRCCPWGRFASTRTFYLAQHFGDVSAPIGSGHGCMAQHPGLRCSRNVYFSVLFRGEWWSNETYYFELSITQLAILQSTQLPVWVMRLAVRCLTMCWQTSFSMSS